MRRSRGNPATIRNRLALTFLALALVFGAGTLTVSYLLVAHILPQKPPPDLQRIMQPPSPGGFQPSWDHFRHLIGPAFHQQQGQMLGLMLIGSLIALVLLGVVAALLSWRIADRILGPLRTITEAARRLSHESLGERIAPRGPGDELKELADTFDGMLARLEQAFRDQRQFVANASHELRTPLAVSRSLLEVALQDPAPSLAGWQLTAQKLLDNNARMEHLIGSLLILARGEQGKAARQGTDLEEIVEDAIAICPRLRHACARRPCSAILSSCASSAATCWRTTSATTSQAASSASRPAAARALAARLE
jgi:signal transduction histidine kinase